MVSLRTQTETQKPGFHSDWTEVSDGESSDERDAEKLAHGFISDRLQLSEALQTSPAEAVIA